jgi:hypothetical protein
LVVGELALALVLLVGATLLIRTFAALHQVDRGFDPHEVLTLRVALTDPHFATTKTVAEIVRTGMERATAIPGVIHAAGTLRAYLFEVRTHDALTFIMAPVLLGIVAFMAVWIPARRASRVDPVQVLRGL